MSNDDTASLVGGSAIAAQTLNIHPRLMTLRRDVDSCTTSSLQTPRNIKVIPTNMELAEAGVTPQDGVVQQLSARDEVKGSLAGPREMQLPRSSDRPAVRTITGGITASKPLLSNGSVREVVTNATPREHQPRKAGLQPARSAPSSDLARHSAANDSSHDLIQSEQNSSRSRAKSLSRRNDPYAHVTSVVHSYRQSNITALEAQYRVIGSRSSPAGTPGGDLLRRDSVSPLSVVESVNIASTQKQPSLPPRDKLQQLSPTPSYSRHNSPPPRLIAEEYLRGGVPRAALDAPHIRYADALQGRNNRRSSSKRFSFLQSTSSAATAEYIPEVATRIPDRFKYVPPTEEERRLHREATLRALEEWRARHRILDGSSFGGIATVESAAQAGPRNNTPLRHRAHARSKQPPPAHSALSEAYASSELQSQESGNTMDVPPHPGLPANTIRPRSAQSREFSTPSSPRHPFTQRSVNGTVSRNDDLSINEDAGRWEQLPKSVGKKSGMPRGRRNSSNVSRDSVRKSRKSLGAASSHLEGGVNPNGFRRKLLFDVAAPTVSVV